MNPPKLKRLFYIAPPLLVAIAALAFLLGPNPERDRRAILAALIADPMPDFSLPPLEGSGVAGFSSADLQAGEVALVNVFASWCFPCRTEHEFLVQLAADRVAAIYGINYRDEPADAVNWLADLGNPYVAIGADKSGRVAIDWGTEGFPETFVIDQAGIIRYRHTGPLSPKILEETILPLIRLLRER